MAGWKKRAIQMKQRTAPSVVDVDAGHMQIWCDNDGNVYSIDDAGTIVNLSVQLQDLTASFDGFYVNVDGDTMTGLLTVPDLIITSLNPSNSGNILTWDENGQLVDSGFTAGDFTSIETDLAFISGAVDTNTTNIATLSGDVTNLEGDVLFISGAVDTNTTNISTNTTNIGINTTNIATISGDLASLQSDVTTVSGDLDALEATVAAINVVGSDNITVVESPSDAWTVSLNSTISGDHTFNNNLNVNNNLTISGDLFVGGTTVTVSAGQVTTSDAIITVNDGEVGTGVTNITAGIEVDRGTSDNYFFLFNETTDNFVIGLAGNLQPVATREENGDMVDGGISIWDAANLRFTTGANLVVDGDGNVVLTGGDFTYAPSIGANWSFAGTAPTGVFEALDDIAAELVSLGGAAITTFDELTDTPVNKTGSNTFVVEVSGTNLVYTDLRGELTTVIDSVSGGLQTQITTISAGLDNISASDVSYTPSELGDWTFGVPSTVQQALDGLAGEISGGVATTFTQLTDTPDNYIGQDSSVVVVSGGELVFNRMLVGSTPLNTSASVYQVTNANITTSSYPFVTIVAPASGEMIVAPHVFGIQSGQFSVEVSEIPAVTGYSLNWMVMGQGML